MERAKYGQRDRWTEIDGCRDKYRQSVSTTERQMDRRRTDTKVDRLIDRHTCRQK